jgi:maltooligosyltrehalose synthase
MDLNIKRRDERRAFFRLLQTYMPVSSNSGNLIESKLEAFMLDFNKSTIIPQITSFNRLTFQLSTSINMPITTSEQWSYVTSAISNTHWETFCTIITLQTQWKLQQNIC